MPRYIQTSFERELFRKAKPVAVASKVRRAGAVRRLRRLLFFKRRKISQKIKKINAAIEWNETLMRRLDYKQRASGEEVELREDNNVLSRQEMILHEELNIIEEKIQRLQNGKAKSP
jgi:hypothetical protein